jgi:putative spermidine/putrescine transport system permease protein
MRVSPLSTPTQTAGTLALRCFAAVILLFLTLPIFIIVPLSFTESTLLIFPPPGWSLRWYDEFFTNPIWIHALKNSLIVGSATMVLATILGTLGALVLTFSSIRYKAIIMAAVISPMIVPIVVTAVAFYFFYSQLGLISTYTGLIMAHTVLGLPFVVITVVATLQGFDRNLIRASASLGASPARTFFSIVFPLIQPGVLSGAIFAFATSFDEIVVALFLAGPEQRTLPRQIFSGIRETISPTIAAVATILVVFSIAMLLTVEGLRRRSERLRGVRRS